MKPITATEYLMGRAKPEDLPEDLQHNMRQVISAANALLAEFGEYRKVNSGYRRPVDNKAAGGSPKSKHMTCQAVDLEDKNGKLKAFCTEDVLEKYGLWMEHGSKTPSWLHVQVVPPRSGTRIFYP